MTVPACSPMHPGRFPPHRPRLDTNDRYSWSDAGTLSHRRPLGRGNGRSFPCHRHRLDRTVAIKTSLTSFDSRFQRKARTIATVNHPNICTLYDVGPNYLVMELCEGETLAARLKRGKLSVEDTLRYGQQIADALAAAHAKGIVHRDLKPSNIMLGKAGIKVLDF